MGQLRAEGPRTMHPPGGAADQLPGVAEDKHRVEIGAEDGREWAAVQVGKLQAAEEGGVGKRQGACSHIHEVHRVLLLLANATEQ